MGQPIIRGIQSVGAVDIYYRYESSDKNLPVPSSFKLGTLTDQKINTQDGGISLSGFRLDEEFLRANPQIASSIVIPILGGGGVAVTNNNRTGSLTLRSTKVSTPVASDGGSTVGSMASGQGFGPVDGSTVFDAVFIAQLQQGQEGGGDSSGATICIAFTFGGKKTLVQFEGCTVGSIDPLALAGNNVADYNTVWNYLNWRVQYDAGPEHFIA